MFVYILSNADGDVLSVHRTAEYAHDAAILLSGLTNTPLDAGNVHIYADRDDIRMCIGYRGPNGEYIVEQHTLGR